MTTWVPIEELQIGMYIILDLSWYEHPFLKNEFRIGTRQELEKIKSLGLPKVKVDMGKSNLERAEEEGSRLEDETSDRPPSTGGDTILSTITHDPSLEPDKKAGLVRQHTTKVLQDLFDHPSKSNILKVKQEAAKIVDLILKDENTTFFLVSLTNFDFTTYNHSVNVGFLSIALAKSAFQNTLDHDLHALGAGFFLHDVGKVKIDPAIITKPAPLTSDEMRIMMRHPQLGFKLLSETNQMTTELKLIVLQHHEKMDGTGYPKGMRDHDIHIYARICTIADVFDALTSRRPYRDPLSTFEALKFMRDEMVPHQLDRHLFEQFVLLFRPPE